jgi:hypothetical protein
LKTIYESFLDLHSNINLIEEEIYKEKFIDLFNKFLYMNINNPDQILDELSKIKSYKEKVLYLENITLNKKKKLNYYDKISLDYLNRIRNL